MSEPDATNALEELVEEAEEQRETFNNARKRLQEVREKLREAVGTLESEGIIDESEADRIRGLVEGGNYGEARQAIAEARKSEVLEFDDEEKDLFARRFSESWEELTVSIESIRTELMELGDGVDREDMVAYLYGSRSGLNKGDIRAVFDAIDEVERTGLDKRQIARVLSAYKHDLKIEPTVEVLEELEKASR